MVVVGHTGITGLRWGGFGEVAGALGSERRSAERPLSEREAAT
jgi:hypothetical protein